MMPQVNIDLCEEKTIKKVLNFDTELIIIFKNDTFTRIKARQCYESAELVYDEKLKINDYDSAIDNRQLIEAGIYTKEELDKAIEERAKQSKENELIYKRSQYERLKKELGEL